MVASEPFYADCYLSILVRFLFKTQIKWHYLHGVTYGFELHLICFYAIINCYFRNYYGIRRKRFAYYFGRCFLHFFFNTYHSSCNIRYYCRCTALHHRCRANHLEKTAKQGRFICKSPSLSAILCHAGYNRIFGLLLFQPMEGLGKNSVDFGNTSHSIGNNCRTGNHSNFSVCDVFFILLCNGAKKILSFLKQKTAFKKSDLRFYCFRCHRHRLPGNDNPTGVYHGTIKVFCSGFVGLRNGFNHILLDGMDKNLGYNRYRYIHTHIHHKRICV